MVNTGRRAQNRAARLSQLVGAASAIVEEKGLDALTMQEVAERVDCAVGTIYTYFSSKSALLASLQANAMRVLADSYEQAAIQWDGVFAESDLDEETVALARIIGLARLFVSWPELQPREFEFLQMLAKAPGRLFTPAELASVLPMALQLFAEARVSHDLAVDVGAISQHPDVPAEDGTARAVRWIGQLQGSVMVASATENLPEDMDTGPFNLRLMADYGTRDMLLAWGADPQKVKAAFEVSDQMVLDGVLLPEPIAKG